MAANFIRHTLKIKSSLTSPNFKNLLKTFRVRKYSSFCTFEHAVSEPVLQECQKWILTNDQCKQIKELLLKNIACGLKRSTQDSASVKCFVTYVQDLPKGDEKGKALALDLGGTNFRILLATLNGKDCPIDVKFKKYEITKELMTGPGENLFKHIATCLREFICEYTLENETLPLGFTFSFPLVQKGLRKGILKQWTKGFTCDGVIGKDVVELLEKEMAKLDLKTKVTVIMNDTTGTLMACAWSNPHCRIGLIIGTGTNACYIEKSKNLDTFDGINLKPNVVINTEWGAFGDDGCLDFIRNDIDKKLDPFTINPGKQLFEKMVSGMYLGELVRLQVCECIKKNIIFGGSICGCVLSEPWKFESKHVTDIESEREDSILECRRTLDTIGMPNISDQDCIDMRYICKVVSVRAAHLVSSGLAALIDKISEPCCTVGIDGSLYRLHPHFHNLMVAKIAELVKPEQTFNLTLAEDGSGIGAAITGYIKNKNKC